MNKENYNSPEFEVDKFSEYDVITTSSGLEGDGENENEWGKQSSYSILGD